MKHESERRPERSSERPAVPRTDRSAVLVELAKSMSRDDGGLVASLRQIAETAARTLGVDTVAVWRFDEQRTELRCIAGCDPTSGQELAGDVVSAERFPAYFQALNEERVLAASNALADPRTAELADEYLLVHGVASLLDAPVWVRGELVGAVCHESRTPREWTEEDALFAGSMSDFVSRALQTYELRVAEARLRDRELRLDQAISGSQGGEWELRAISGRGLLEGGWCWLSPRLKAFIGYGPNDFPNLWTAWRELVHPTDRAAIATAAEDHLEGRAPHYEALYRIRHRDGTWRTIHSRGSIARDDKGRPVRWSGICWDVTEVRRAEEERARLEARMSETQKLESLGVLSSGIAHDFNNLLAAILGNAGLALADLPEDVPGREFVEEIERAAQRAAELTSQLLAYSGRGSAIVESVDLNALVEEMVRLLQVSISKKAHLNLALQHGLAPVVGDATQLRQVVMNLLTNASDALRGEPGSISITTGLVPADRRLLSDEYGAPEAVEGDYDCIEVSDTGCGMGAATVERIFDPFFSTKGSGRGLGLAAVRGIVRHHRGLVRVFSEPGVGTTIRVLLPASTRGASETAGKPELAPGELLEGLGTILVADDDEGVRRVAATALERAGYRVLLAGDGAEALECFRAHADEIGLALLDLTMPGLDGEQVLREIRALRPDARVVLASGYGESGVSREATDFLSKPFRPDQLVALVSRNVALATPPER